MADEPELGSGGGSEEEAVNKPAVVPCKNRKKRGSIVWAPVRVSAIPPKYNPCPHIFFKNQQQLVSRLGISREEHMNLLAQSNPTPWVKRNLWGQELVKFRRRPITERTEQLAVPRLGLVRAHVEENKYRLSPEMLQRLEKILAEALAMTPEEIKKFLDSKKKKKKRKKKKKCKVMEQTSEEFMKSLLEKMADDAAEIVESRPPPMTQRLENMILAILSRLAGFVGIEPPAPGCTSLLARLLMVLAEKLACWVEGIACEADALPDEPPPSPAANQTMELFNLLLNSTCGPHPAPCGRVTSGPRKRGRKKRRKKRRTCMKIIELCGGECELEPPPPPPPPYGAGCTCACMCERPRRKKHGKKGKGKRKGKGGRKKEEDESDASGDEDQQGDKKKQARDGGPDKEDVEGKKGGGDSGIDVLDTDGEGETDGGGETAGETDEEGGGATTDEEGAGGETGGEEQGRGRGGVDSAKGSSSSKPGSQTNKGGSATNSKVGSGGSKGGSKTSAKTASSKSSSGGGGGGGGGRDEGKASNTGSAVNSGGSKSSAKPAASKSSGNAGGSGGSKTSAKSSGNVGGSGGGGSKTSAKSGGSKGGGSGGSTKSPSKGASKSAVSTTPSENVPDVAEEDESAAQEGQDQPAVEEPAVEEVAGDVADAGGEEVAEDTPPPGGEEVGAEEVAGEEGTAGEETDSPGGADEEESDLNQLADEVASAALMEAALKSGNVTFESILQQLSIMVEETPDSEKTERRAKLMKTLEAKFSKLVEADENARGVENIDEIVASVADKVAMWMDGVMRSAESRISVLGEGGGKEGEDAYIAQPSTDGTLTIVNVGSKGTLKPTASPVQSKDIREWAEWIVGVMGVAEDWAGWISETVAAAEEKAQMKRGEMQTSKGEVRKLTRDEWNKWKDDVKKGVVDFRMRKKTIAETAHAWDKRTKGRGVISSKGASPQPTSIIEMQEEEEQRVTQMDGGGSVTDSASGKGNRM